MEITCPHCGETLECETGEVVEGQNVLCPSCGKKFVFRKPNAPHRQSPFARNAAATRGPVKPSRYESAEDGLLRWIRGHKFLSCLIFVVAAAVIALSFATENRTAVVARILFAIIAIVFFALVVRVIRGLFVFANSQPIFLRVFFAVLLANLVTIIIWRLTEPSKYVQQPYPGVIIEGTRHINGEIYLPKYNN